MNREFTVFSVGDMNFALDVGNVREVLRAAALSPVPENANIEGLLNLRGVAVPVIDIRSRLSLPSLPTSASNFLIVIESGSRQAAIRTEQQAQLEQASESSIDLASSTAATCDLISGTVQLGDRFVSLLNAAAILAVADLGKPRPFQGETTDPRMNSGA
ncbi:MAG: chemotaxis protein CheW [Planctomycetota bacterium]|nr:chemotaxis protein CheW [Planctomycetota bacterium]